MSGETIEQGFVENKYEIRNPQNRRSSLVSRHKFDIKLSKTMSYFLRHHPDEAGLVLDEEGMVPIEALVSAINKRRGFGWVTEQNIRHVVKSSDKQRFRIQEERIGARYGHNRKIRIVKPGTPIEPPELLYHGTPRRAVPSILKQGLLSQGRQFVHLSATPETAQNVGNRRDRQPAMLLIKARQAHAAGINFYAPTSETYLAEHIPPTYITVMRGE